MRDDCELPIKNSVSSQDDGQEILVFFFSNAFLNVSSRQFKRRAHSLSINSSQCMSKRTSMMRDSAAAPPADIKTMSAVVEPLVMIQLSYFLLLIKKKTTGSGGRETNKQTSRSSYKTTPLITNQGNSKEQHLAFSAAWREPLRAGHVFSFN